MKIVYDTERKSEQGKVYVLDENKEIDIAFFYKMKLMFKNDILDISTWGTVKTMKERNKIDKEYRDKASNEKKN